MQHAKSVADELVMLDTQENLEDLTVKILNSLGDEFKDISTAVRARDSVIIFEELHEKLLNFEAVLKQEMTNNHKLNHQPVVTKETTVDHTTTTAAVATIARRRRHLLRTSNTASNLPRSIEQRQAISLVLSTVW